MSAVRVASKKITNVEEVGEGATLRSNLAFPSLLRLDPAFQFCVPICPVPWVPLEGTTLAAFVTEGSV